MTHCSWLKLLFLISELSLAISSVIVIKLDGDEEEAKKIAAIIEAKISKQEEVLKQLKDITKAQNSTIGLLNSTFQDAYDLQQEQIKNLTEKNIELKSQIKQITSIIEAKIHTQNEELKQLKNLMATQNNKINSTFKDAFNHQQGQIKNLSNQNKELKQEIQVALNSSKKGKQL